MSIKKRLERLEKKAPRKQRESIHGSKHWAESMQALGQALGFTGTLEELEGVIKCL